jgi:hypothetical protein
MLEALRCPDAWDVMLRKVGAGDPVIDRKGKRGGEIAHETSRSVNSGAPEQVIA